MSDVVKRVFIPIKATIHKIMQVVGNDDVSYKLSTSGILIALSGIPAIIFFN